MFQISPIPSLTREHSNLNSRWDKTNDFMAGGRPRLSRLYGLTSRAANQRLHPGLHQIGRVRIEQYGAQVLFSGMDPTKAALLVGINVGLVI